jgi:glycosyltransferase involved in cell wall biosynthesis
MFLCGSSEIRQNLEYKYGIDSNVVYYKEFPIESEIDYVKQYSNEKSPIKIAYAARITKNMKRADLLIELIRILEKKKVYYCLNIAGEGDYLPTLENFINQNDLSSKIKLYGKIEHKNMVGFWKNNDIFLNVSDSEGIILSLLEALSYGLVPVVTKVGGAIEFVVNSGKGFVVDVEDIEKIAEKIEYLEQNRSILCEHGKYFRKLIKNKCNVEDYGKFINNMLCKEHSGGTYGKGN